MGAWIETPLNALPMEIRVVAPLWERGLKPVKKAQVNSLESRSLVGAWIETSVDGKRQDCFYVAPLWERGLKPSNTLNTKSGKRVAPLWERGLKHIDTVDNGDDTSRSLVGAWIET